MDDELREIREEKLQSLTEAAEGGDAAAEAGAPDEPVHVQDQAHLRDLTGTNGVVLVDFYADWCGPCKMLEPVVETLAAETEAAVAKVDVDAHQQLAGQFQVRGVPTVVVFADGEPVERFSGVRGEEELRSLIGRYT